MDIQDLQSQVKLFVEENNIDCPIETRMLDLQSEIGEVSKEILKSTNYGKVKFEVTSDLKEEMGDVFFSLIALANSCNINLAEVLESTLNKYNLRLSKNGNVGSDY